MIDISPEWATLLMFSMLIGLITTGYPLSLVLGGTAMVMGLLGVGFSILDTFYLRAYAAVTEYTFLAIPLFIFMAIMVERSGISEKVFSTLFVLMGGLRGSLAIVTVITGEGGSGGALAIAAGDVVVALENAVSIAGVLLLAEATLTEIEEPAKERAPLEE